MWLGDVEKYRDNLLDALVDRHGPGRMIFRNTRRIMKNFPERKLITHEFKLGTTYQKALEDKSFETLQDIKEFVDSAALEVGLEDDSRIAWVIDFLKEKE